MSFFKTVTSIICTFVPCYLQPNRMLRLRLQFDFICRRPVVMNGSKVINRNNTQTAVINDKTTHVVKNFD